MGNKITLDDAVTILLMADVCLNEGQGPNYEPLVKSIFEQHPHLKAEYAYLIG